MNKQAIIASLTQHYKAFTEYINGLSQEEYTHRYQQKWTAGQQLEHMVMSVKPLVQVLGVAPEAIAANFGTTAQAGRSYDELKDEYKKKLAAGGKAPSRFLPGAVPAAQKTELTAELDRIVEELGLKIGHFTEHELDTLCLPHPLLGKLSIREMLYNAIYHVQHHHDMAKQNLEKFS